MATDRQIAANRRNAQKSTGPRSAEGKAASSQNALKTGIDARSQVIRGEDRAALQALAAEYHAEFQPRSAAERSLVDMLIDAEWLLRRLRLSEAHLWEDQFEKMSGADLDDPLGRAFSYAQQTFAHLERRRDSLQRTFRTTLKELRKLQADTHAHVPAPTAAPDSEIGFVPSPGAVPNAPAAVLSVIGQHPRPIPPCELPPPPETAA